MAVGVIVGVVFVCSALVAAGLSLFMVNRADRRRIDDRLREVTTGPDLGDSDGASDLVKTEAASPLPGLDSVARATAAGSSIERWLGQSGVRMTFSALIVITIVSALVCAFGAGMFFQRGWAGGVGALVGAVLPLAYLRQKRASRMAKFEEYFPEALELISRALRAGHALSAGMKMAADELEEPVGPEFRRTFDEQNFGLPLADALNHLSERIPSLDVKFFVIAVLIQRETGGNLSEILDNLAHVVRERFKILRQVRVHTAHGRMTGWVMLALPAFLLIALTFIAPDHVNLLFTEQIGHYLLIATVVLQTVGYLWIRQVVKIEV